MRLRWRVPSLSSGWSLRSLTALAEAHVRERCDPSHDPLTGALDAEAFHELWQVYARHAAGREVHAAPLAVVLTLLDCGELRGSGQIPSDLRALAALCVEHVAADDYVGRIGQASIAVLPRNGGLRGARSVRARLLDACRKEFARLPDPLRLEVELRDVAGVAHEHGEELLGALPPQ